MVPSNHEKGVLGQPFFHPDPFPALVKASTRPTLGKNAYDWGREDNIS